MRTLALIIFFIFNTTNAFSNVNQAAANQNILSYLRNDISEFNKNLPAQVDKWTRYDSVWIVNNKLFQSFTILTLKNAKVPIPANLINDLKQEVVNGFCTQPSLKGMRELNIPVIKNYSATNGEFLFEFEVSTSDCTATMKLSTSEHFI